jgi:hypothetical protein
MNNLQVLSLSSNGSIALRRLPQQERGYSESCGPVPRFEQFDDALELRE